MDPGGAVVIVAGNALCEGCLDYWCELPEWVHYTPLCGQVLSEHRWRLDDEVDIYMWARTDASNREVWKREYDILEQVASVYRWPQPLRFLARRLHYRRFTAPSAELLVTTAQQQIDAALADASERIDQSAGRHFQIRGH